MLREEAEIFAWIVVGLPYGLATIGLVCVLLLLYVATRR